MIRLIRNVIIEWNRGGVAGLLMFMFSGIVAVPVAMRSAQTQTEYQTLPPPTVLQPRTPQGTPRRMPQTPRTPQTPQTPQPSPQSSTTNGRGPQLRTDPFPVADPFSPQLPQPSSPFSGRKRARQARSPGTPVASTSRTIAESPGVRTPPGHRQRRL